MTQSLYKAIQRTALNPKVVELLRGNDLKMNVMVGGVPCPARYATHRIAEVVLDEHHLKALTTIQNWLEEQGSQDTSYLNCYCRLSDDKATLTTTWTFGDLDEALMFKLSLV